MRLTKLFMAIVATGVLGTSAWAAGEKVEQDQQRNVNQQERIEQGLQSGELNTQEAGRLEREQQRVDGLEARDLKDGSISPAEQARLKAAQDKASADIYREKHDAREGNPESKSSERLQTEVQRNVNQQERIQNGIESGALTNREAGSLERGQARVERNEANAAADGHVGPAEQHRIQAREHHQSQRVYHQKHNERSKQPT